MPHFTPHQTLLVFQVCFAALFVIFAIASIVQQRKRNAKLAESLRALAEETGGAFSVEKRSIDNLMWVGGPTVRWTIRGVPVTLEEYRKQKSSGGMRLRGRIRLARPFQFHMITQGALARMVMSPRLWNAVIEQAEKEAVKKAERAGASAETARDAVEKLRFMASEPVRTGDSLFDEAFLLKSDDPDRARDLLTSSGLSYWTQELRKAVKSWTLAVTVADSNGGYWIALEMMGGSASPEALRSARSIVEAVIGRLADQGAVADTGSGRPAA